MTHANAPVNIEGRRRLIERCRSRPIAQVAAEGGVSRACLSKWKSRYDQYGEAGLRDRSSAPHFSPTQTPPDVVERIERLRRDNKGSARRIALEPANQGVRISERTVGRRPARLGINHRRFLDPDGSADRRPPKRIVARYPGHMVHLDVKKVGAIPDGGGWRAHGRGSEQARAAQRAKTAGTKGGYIYLHSAVDGFSRLAYTATSPTRRPPPPWCSSAAPARSSPPTASTGSCAWSPTAVPTTEPHFARSLTSRASRHQRILAEELLYARQ